MGRSLGDLGVGSGLAWRGEIWLVQSPCHTEKGVCSFGLSRIPCHTEKRVLRGPNLARSSHPFCAERRFESRSPSWCFGMGHCMGQIFLRGEGTNASIATRTLPSQRKDFNLSPEDDDSGIGEGEGEMAIAETKDIKAASTKEVAVKDAVTPEGQMPE